MGCVSVVLAQHLTDTVLVISFVRLSSHFRTFTFSHVPMPTISTPMSGKSAGLRPGLVM